MEDMGDNISSKRRVRPTQKLYVPPAQRTRKINTNNVENATTKINNKTGSFLNNEENTTKINNKTGSLLNIEENATITVNNKTGRFLNIEENSTAKIYNNKTGNFLNTEENATTQINDEIPEKIENPSERIDTETNSEEKNVQIEKSIDLTNDKSEENKSEEVVITIKSNRTGPDKNDSEDLKRVIQTNVNKKPKPLIKPVNKNDVLQIDTKNISNKSIKKSPVKLLQVANWEDLFSEEDQEDNYNNQLDYDETDDTKSDSEPDDPNVDHKIQELEHVIELYDFPSTFKTQDIMQIYNEINKESIYIKWCDETHALLVLGSAIQAQRALVLKHDIIKSRPMTLAGSIAKEVAAKCDLKPAMKRPQTSMHTARRMITTGLGIKTQISKEIQQKEREALRIAKELKKVQKQNERDAWEGNPRPSTA